MQTINIDTKQGGQSGQSPEIGSIVNMLVNSNLETKEKVYNLLAKGETALTPPKAVSEDEFIFLTLPEAAEVCRLSTRTLQRASLAGRLKVFQPNGKWGHIRVSKAELLRFLSSDTREAVCQ